MRRLTVLALVVLAASACGGSGGSSIAPTTAASTVAPTSPPTSAATIASTAAPPGDTSTATEPSAAPSGPAGFYSWDGQTWTANGALPACPDDLTGFFEQSPVDVALATAVLAPGQVRGGNYKAHGGFRFDGAANDDIAVVLPADATLWSAARYVEAGEVQYLLQFRTPCGIMFRFDHLRVLAEPVQAAIAEVPEAADGSSATTMLREPFDMRAGDLVATSVGFAATNNVSMDFGVYDPRGQNAASTRPDFPEQQFRELTWYGVCWYSMLPPDAAAVVAALPGGDATAGRTSDYCAA